METINKTAVSDEKIGILVLNADYPLIPGNVANASSYDFPVRFQTVDLPTRWWFELNEEKYQIFIEAAKKLESAGVKAIVCGCGLFVVWQDRASKQLDIPIFTSPLIFASAISKLVGGRTLGIITAAGDRLKEERFLKPSGIDESVPFVIGGLDTCSEFLDVIRYQTKKEMDRELFERQVIEVAQTMLDENENIGAFLLECSDIPPFAKAISEHTGKPVFDFISIANMLYRSIEQRSYGQR